ncbi:NlpC/P60 family protein [Limosilactobacillus reuteri]|uniref:NlpC/P60 family protein n=1 Tax=Limosilactobacillus reuteri TaxID=1598 RepID=UPI001E2DF110|nr:NlpC/P60 family protein [Limosilactobacillus reuteri]MCC4348909.1 NlpC/P60 family protein [Limosilactobacillus reuteri]MCC4374891.1 NlpC/P60 family protein [Limosilactobacillus reuteri]MCC4385046.1 NlpC/P60 family protein [Limosilactobacillus reuteri]
MDTKKHYKLYKDGKKWCVMTIAAVASVIGLATTANADDTDTTTSPVQTAQVADNSNVAELPQSNVESVQANSNPANQDIENENLNSSVISDDKSTTPVQPQSAQEKNGWVNENNNWTYYNNGQVTNGRDYTYLPTINGGGHSWYLVDNGVVQSGVQQWAGSYYDFDANNNYQRVDNNYVQSQWGDWYLFGNDGRIQTGVQQWAGTYYYFDPTTYLRVDNDYRQAQWGDWYLFGNDGRILSGLQNWKGQTYYFDPSTFKKVVNSDVTVNGTKYHLDNDGIAKAVSNVDAKVDKALSQRGVPYVWGGNTPAGFDCSGLVQWAYGLGSSYRTTYQQATLGTHKRDVINAPKGSLLFFGSDSAPYHVAISLGNGSYVHAPEPGDVVKIGYSKFFTPSFYITM